MKQYFLLALIAVSLLTSCSSAYKSGQTPDDVYYSPAREVKEETKRQDTKQEYASNDDNYLHMKVRSYSRWSVIDDYSYWNDTRYSHCNSYSPFIKTSYSWSPYYYGNTWYNPYFTLIPYKNPTVFIKNTSATNILAYTNTKYNNSNTLYNPKTGLNTANNNGLGNLFKKAFSTSSNGTTSTWDRPVRTFDSPSSTTSSSSSTTTTSSSAGGNSGGYSSSGSSTSSGRGGRN